MAQQDWINIHTHKPGKGINIVDPCPGNIPVEADGTVYYSLGIHPMYIDGNTELRWKEIERAAAEKRIVAIGEAGMDRNSRVPMEVQGMWFERQAELAARYHLPLIIHGVRAIPELISAYKKCKYPGGWIMHGFNNRKEILQDLLKHGFYISAGRHVLNKASHIWQLLPDIPLGRLFVETDDSDYPIEEIYQTVAERKGIDTEQLLKVVGTNFSRLFSIQE